MKREEYETRPKFAKETIPKTKVSVKSASSSTMTSDNLLYLILSPG